MWVIAGVLLGLVVLVVLAGLHTGPHTHLVAAALGVLTAVWLVVMAVDSSTRGSLVYSLLAADLVVSGGVGAASWRALRGSAGSTRTTGPHHQLDGAMGVALGDLSPSGIVRVRGESWSATAMNGHVAAGGAVQVIGVEGVRLQVWGEETELPLDKEHPRGNEDGPAGLGSGEVAL